MNDDFKILASMYLDNAATPEERAEVEASPELLAEVKSQRLVRALLTDVESPSISLREQHLATALGAWDRLPQAERTTAVRDTTPTGIGQATASAAATISTPSPTSLAGHRRSKATGWLIAAAAALALVVAGGVVAQNIQLGGSDDDSSSADAPTPVDEQPDPNSSTAIADNAAEEFSRDSELSTGAVEESSDDFVIAAGEISAEESDDGGLDIDAEAPPQNDDLEVLSTREQLGIFASDAVGAPVSPDFPESTEAPADTTTADEDQSIAESVIENLNFPLCAGVDYVVGPAEFQGEFVVVAVDESRNLAVAYRALDCSVVATVQLP